MNSNLNKLSNNYYKYLKSSLMGSESSSSKGILVNDGFIVQIDKNEYGIQKRVSDGSDEFLEGDSMDFQTVQFNPREMGILANYRDEKVLYHEKISNTRVFLSQNL